MTAYISRAAGSWLFRLRFLGEPKGGVEVAPLEGRFRLVHFRRRHATGTKGAVHLRLPHAPSREPSCPSSPSAAECKTRMRSTASCSSGRRGPRSGIHTDSPCLALIWNPTSDLWSSFQC